MHSIDMLIPSAIFFIFTQVYYPPQSRVQLSKEELKFADSLSQKYQCDVSLHHDYYAIIEKRKDGVLTLQFKNGPTDLCVKDSLFLKEISPDIAKQLFKIVKYKGNYNSVEVVFYKSEKTNAMEWTLCEKAITVIPPDFNDPQISYYSTTGMDIKKKNAKKNE